jgi:hypothetical protein
MFFSQKEDVTEEERTYDSPMLHLGVRQLSHEFSYGHIGILSPDGGFRPEAILICAAVRKLELVQHGRWYFPCWKRRHRHVGIPVQTLFELCSSDHT